MRIGTRNRLGLVGTSLIALSLLLAGSPASAQEASASQRSLARQLFSQGVEHAQANRWDEARDAFQQAYDLVPNPTILLNLAGSQVQSGRLVEGAEAYRQFLREVTSGALARQRPAAEEALSDVEARIPRLRLVVPGLQDGDVVKLDGEPLMRAVLNNELPISPGEHVVIVERDGALWGQGTVTIAERELKQFEVTLEAPANVPTPEELAAQQGQEDDTIDLTPTRPEHHDNSMWIYIGAGVGGAVVVGVLVGVLVATSGGTKSPYNGGNWGTLELQ